MADFTVKTRFTFEGEFTIKNVSNAAMALDYVQKHCGLVLGGDVHSSLPEEEVDWNFPVHPNKTFGAVKRSDNGRRK